jgi:hypothetical protein
MAGDGPARIEDCRLLIADWNHVLFFNQRLRISDHQCTYESAFG